MQIKWVKWLGLYTSRTRAERPPEKLFHSALPHLALAGFASQLSTRGMSSSSTDHDTAIFWLFKVCSFKTVAFIKKKKNFVRSFAGCADLNLAGLAFCVTSSMMQVVMILSSQ